MTYYTGWLIPEGERHRLLSMFEPKYPDVIAHHITLLHGVKKTVALPTETEALLVGICDDGRSLEALVFSINGTHIRPDGSTYHCTWSLDEASGRKAKDSNTLIKERGFTPFKIRTPVTILPALMN
jgi:hypothetical protein